MRITTVFASLAAVSSQFGGDGPGMLPKKVKPSPLNADLPYIKCGVCEKMIHEALRQTTALVEEKGTPTKTKKRRFDSDSSAGSLQEGVEDMLTKLCDADADGKDGSTKEGRWMSEYDIRKSGSALVLDHKGPGFCRRECRTIAKSCDDVMSTLGDADEDLGELLVSAVKSSGGEKPQSPGVVAQRVCTKLAGVCKKKKIPIWPEGKARKNEEFKPEDPKDDSINDLLASLKGMPGGGGAQLLDSDDMDLGDDGKVDPIDVLKDEV